MCCDNYFVFVVRLLCIMFVCGTAKLVSIQVCILVGPLVVSLGLSG